MRYAKIEKNSIANGPGIRVVLWCQGCRVNCPGCHNPQTHNFIDGKDFNTAAVQEICEELDKPYIAGLTLSGGHPLEPENIKECTALARYLKLKYPNKTIWLYTGFLWEGIKDYEIFKYIDICVDGPFIIDRKNISLPYCGSTNQRIIDVKKTLEYNKITLYERDDVYEQKIFKEKF